MGSGRGRRQKMERARQARPFSIRCWVLFCRGHASVSVEAMFGILKFLCRCEALLFRRRPPPLPFHLSPPHLRGRDGGRRWRNLPRIVGFAQGVDHD